MQLTIDDNILFSFPLDGSERYAVATRGTGQGCGGRFSYSTSLFQSGGGQDNGYF